ncbi:MAG: sporulation protein YqfD [Oscillospiraceae bacterium]|nr:sporulation protein YqfD [Oscillospiraceae bacterium]
MQRVVNFLGGQVRIEVVCAYPERVLNLAAQSGVGFWDMSRVDEITIGMTVSLAGFRKLRPLLEKLDAEVRLVRRRGAPVFLRRFRGRYVLIAGLLITLIATWVLSLYIWDIQVEGNETVPGAVILRALEDVGVYIGTFGSGVDPELVRNEVLLQLPDVAWLTVNVNGGRARVIVRERVHAPERFAEDLPTAVYATGSGIVDQMMVWAGTPLVEVGDTVVIGQDLVTGRMESLALGTSFQRADAKITVRSWYELSMSMPLDFIEKVYTGETRAKSIIFFGQSRINLFFDSGISYTSYDKIVRQSDFHLPGGIVLPIRLERRSYAAFQPRPARLDETTAALRLGEQLLARLEALIGPEGQVLSTDFRVEVGEGIVTVHLEAEVREQVAALRRLEPEEMVVVEEMFITEEPDGRETD